MTMWATFVQQHFLAAEAIVWAASLATSLLAWAAWSATPLAQRLAAREQAENAERIEKHYRDEAARECRTYYTKAQREAMFRRAW
jgi:hypothetical protein